MSERDMATPFLSVELATYFLNNMFFYTSLLFPPISGLRFSQNVLTDGLPVGQRGECVTDSDLPRGELRSRREEVLEPGGIAGTGPRGAPPGAIPSLPPMCCS